ncbi:MAG: hypothetical protein CMC08_01985, partial [Flavobacteriaceae bacterium]|nr:hypothetical protein [Flavobacteriaceae bacterium]
MKTTVHSVRPFLSLLVFLLVLHAAWGQQTPPDDLLAFEFSGLTGSEATAPATAIAVGISPSVIARGPSNTPGNKAGRFNATNWPTGQTADPNNYFEVTVAPTIGYRFGLSSIYVQLQRSGTGPRMLSVRSSLDNFTADIDSPKVIAETTATQAFTFTLSQPVTESAVTYRFYFYNALGSVGSGGIGNGTGNDLVFSGSIEQVSGNTPPSISNIVRAPSGAVTSSDAVSVSAQLTDSDGILQAQLHWGTAPGVYAHTIALAASGGDVFTTATPIPPQASGTSVFYSIEATDGHTPAATASSPEHGYAVTDPTGAPSAIVTEMSQGHGGRKEWVELLVVTDQLNMQGWQVGDNDNGVFNPFLTFSNDAQWAAVAAGTLITVYNSNEPDDVIVPDLDFGDLSVVIPSDNGQYFDPGGWGNFSNSEGDDAAAIRNAVGSIVHDMAGDHPTAIITAPITARTKYYIGPDNAASNLVNPTHWVEAAAADGTPSQPNGGFNTVFVNSLRGTTTYYYDGNTWFPSHPSGTATLADDILVMGGSAQLTSETQARRALVESGATLEVHHILTVGRGIYNGGTLVFGSSATQQGELGALPGDAVLVGEVTVQRYLGAHRAYRLLSSPVTTTQSIRDAWQEGVNNPTTTTMFNPNPGFGTHITGSLTGANGFDASGSGNVSLYSVDVPNQVFVPATNTDTQTLVGGMPHLLFVRGDRSIDLTTNQAPPTETVLRATGTLPTGNVTQLFEVTAPGDFIVFGNPYQCAVNVNAVLAGNADVNTNFYYVYDPTLGAQGSYTTVDLTTQTATGGSLANQYLQPWQVGQVATVNAGTVAVEFQQAHKAPGNHTPTLLPEETNGTDEYVLDVRLFTKENFLAGKPLH